MKLPKLTYTNFKKKYPNASNCWKSWFSVQRHWDNRLISIYIKHHAITLDFRDNWIKDMTETAI